MIRDLYQYLHRYTRYEDGHLYWIAAPTSWLRVGDRVGGSAQWKKMKYRAVVLRGKSYTLHRLIYIYHHKEIKGYIHHKDGDLHNNRIENLVDVYTGTNTVRSKHKRNKSGFLGVTYRPLTNQWRANIFVKGKQVHLGIFNTAKEASKAYENARKILILMQLA